MIITVLTREAVSYDLPADGYNGWVRISMDSYHHRDGYHCHIIIILLDSCSLRIDEQSIYVEKYKIKVRRYFELVIVLTYIRC